MTPPHCRHHQALPPTSPPCPYGVGRRTIPSHHDPPSPLPSLPHLPSKAQPVLFKPSPISCLSTAVPNAPSLTTSREKIWRGMNRKTREKKEANEGRMK
ncbi:hypothetical protein M0R45_030046 [Rubus argutus]|uniref:Uncharacterized protein n=1 Tax=Rubus argutus TaxID=59490 RepID=A0AAW1WA41_RUBAR